MTYLLGKVGQIHTQPFFISIGSYHTPHAIRSSHTQCKQFAQVKKVAQKFANVKNYVYICSTIKIVEL